MNKIKILTPVLTCFSLVGLFGCSNTSASSVSSKTISSAVNSSSSLAVSSAVDTSNLKIVSPVGAPSLSLQSFMRDNSTNITLGTPKDVVLPALIKGDADIVIFDLATGAKQIAAGKINNYTVVGALTLGNVDVIATASGKNKQLDDNASIYSFGTNSIFTGILRSVYGLSSDKAIPELADTSVAATAALTGLVEGKEVDFVLVAEPQVTRILSQEGATCSLYANLTAKWAEYSLNQGLNGGKGYSGYPQAGIFLNKKYEDKSQDALINSALDKIYSASADFALNSGKNVLAAINEDVSAGKYQSNAFGVGLPMITKAASSQTNPSKVTNALGFASNKNFDFNKFYAEAKLSGYPAINSQYLSAYCSNK